MTIKTGQRIKINGKLVTIEGTAKSKFGTILYFRTGGESKWCYEHEIN